MAKERKPKWIVYYSFEHREGQRDIDIQDAIHYVSLFSAVKDYISIKRFYSKFNPASTKFKIKLYHI